MHVSLFLVVFFQHPNPVFLSILFFSKMFSLFLCFSLFEIFFFTFLGYMYIYILSDEEREGLLEKYKQHSKCSSFLKEFQCNLCDRIYYKSHALKTHIDSVHLKKTNYDCKECEKSFYMKRDLDNHINSHKGVKSYQCDVCNKSFGHVSNLNRHKRTHTKEQY